MPISGEEMASSLLYGDNNLHQAVIETFYACNRVTETLGDDHTDTTGGPGTAAQNGLEAAANVPRLAAGPPRLLHRLSFFAPVLQPVRTSGPSTYPHSSLPKGSCLLYGTFGRAQLPTATVLALTTLAYFSHSPGSASARRLPRAP
ncbi:unnamed protein product [Heligmosomoides polygyrus]|uniref:Uncharacterized protein n=1 Tax=Heligmosomoides polygyrus TaxID=6339 RepID=A0A183FRB4_HELPZ|nr:unnamed protein product [Heligmosomoides polygyrus]